MTPRYQKNGGPAAGEAAETTESRAAPSCGFADWRGVGKP
jgi:hypothetical protein